MTCLSSFDAAAAAASWLRFFCVAAARCGVGGGVGHDPLVDEWWRRHCSFVDVEHLSAEKKTCKI
jgi:hypothetical protein